MLAAVPFLNCSIRREASETARISKFMKIAIYLDKESIEIRDLPMPGVGSRDVLIQNIYSSICGTDVAVFSHGRERNII